MLTSLQVFGWPKTEVEGKNVSVLMPAPHSQQHTGFIRNYLDSGKAKVLNTTRELQALHRDRFVFPVKLALTKIAQGGERLLLCVPCGFQQMHQLSGSAAASRWHYYEASCCLLYQASCT